MKKSLLLFLLLALFAGESLHAQRREDYRDFGATPRGYFQREINTDNLDFYQTSCYVLFSSDLPDNCHAPLVIDVSACDKGNDAWQETLSFYQELMFTSSYTLMEIVDFYANTNYLSAKFQWYCQNMYWRLFNCTWNALLRVRGYKVLGNGIFAGTNSLEQVEISSDFERLQKDAFSGCKNLKYVKFDSDSHLKYIEQDVFWGCDALEVIEFDTDDNLYPENIKHMFSTKYYVNTHPNMKAFVVRDRCVDRLKNRLNEVFKPVKDGTCRVMSKTEFYSPRVTGVTLDTSAVNLPVGSTYQFTANVLPSNTWDRDVIWSSDNPSVATVSSTGLITRVSMGTATITAMSREDNGHKATCTVIPADYIQLKTLSVAGYAFSGGFNANTTAYTVTVPSSTASVDIVATANNYPGVSVTGTGNKTVAVGNTILPVTVSSGSPLNLSKTYNVTVHRKSTDATLKSLTVGGSALPLNTFTHNITVPNATGTFAITGEANYALTTVSGTGNKTLNAGDNTFTVTVTPEEGQPKTYTIVVHRKSVDATLKSITLNNGDIPFEFNPATLNYTVDASHSVSSIMIAATANDSFATVSGDTGNQTLNMGDNRFSVTVTPEEGQPITYTIRVYRGAASLKSLAVSSGTLSPAFDAGTLNYSVAVPNSMDSITVTAEANNAAAQVTGAGVKTLNVGDNRFDIAVDFDDPAINTMVYSLNVRRLSNDASLKSIRIASVDTSFEVSPPFDPGVYEYRAFVPAETAITVSGETGDTSATVTGFGHYSSDFFNYREKTIWVSVVSEDGGADRRYKIEITRQSNDASLKSLRLSPDCLTTRFDPAVTYYSATVPYSVAKVEISAEPSDPLADAFSVYDLPGVKPLKAGYNRFVFAVRSTDKENSMLYLIDIFRENSPTGIHETGTPAALHVYSANGRLHVDSPVSERINIYSVAGTLLYSFDKPAGAFRLSAFSFHPASILIVKGSSGWVRKVMM